MRIAFRRTSPLLRAVGYSLALLLIYVLCVCTPIGQRLDGATLGAFPAVQSDGWLRVYGARDVIPVLLCAAAGILAAVSFARRRIIPAIAALTLLVSVFALSRLLDQLPRPGLGAFGYAHNTFPSGHTAVSLAGVVAIGWALPAPYRLRLLLVPSVLAFLVAAFSLLSFAHRGSDVVGGALLAGAVAAGIAAVGGSSRPGLNARERLPGGPRLVLASAVMVVVLVAAIAQGVQAPLMGAASLLAVAAISVSVVLDETGAAPSAAWTDRQKKGDSRSRSV